MLDRLKGRLAAMYRSLTRAGQEQPIHKLALAVVLLLDVFILISIFDGLEAHTRQLASPDVRISRLCREIVIDRGWTPEARMGHLAEVVASRRSAYRDPAEREPRADPACARVLAPIDAIATQGELGEMLERRKRLTSEVRDADTALAREKGAYDTHLLEALAKPGAEGSDVKAILATVQRRTAAIEAARRRIAEIDASLGESPRVSALWAALDALGPADAASLAADLRRIERWYSVKQLGMRLLFLLPLFAAFAAWHSASARKGRGLQALVSSHLVVVTSIPVLFEIADAVYDILPKRLLKRLIDLLESLKLVALWHYLFMALAVAFALGLVIFIQRRLFSRERLLEKRIEKGQCQRCGRRLPPGARACPFCGFGQDRPCPACGGPTPVHARYCTGCGAAAGLGER